MPPANQPTNMNMKQWPESPRTVFLMRSTTLKAALNHLGHRRRLAGYNHLDACSGSSFSGYMGVCLAWPTSKYTGALSAPYFHRKDTTFALCSHCLPPRLRQCRFVPCSRAGRGEEDRGHGRLATAQAAQAVPPAPPSLKCPLTRPLITSAVHTAVPPFACHSHNGPVVRLGLFPVLAGRGRRSARRLTRDRPPSAGTTVRCGALLLTHSPS